MDNMEIPELSKEAKRPGLRSYSRLKKQELIEKIQRDWLLKSERLPIFLMKKFRWTSINQFSNQKKIRKGSGNPNNRYRKRKTRKGKQRNPGDAWIEGRSTGSQPRRRPFTKNKNIKSRGSRARKKNQRDQRDKQKPPQMVETARFKWWKQPAHWEVRGDNLQLQAKNKVLVPGILCKERNR